MPKPKASLLEEIGHPGMGLHTCDRHLIRHHPRDRHLIRHLR